MATESILKGKGLLTPIQQGFLRAFSQIPDQRQFYLSGGTALAEFFLGHRFSFDLDLFTGEDGLVLPVSYQVEKMGASSSFQITVIRRFSTFAQLMIEHGQESLKVDLAFDSPFRFAPPTPTELGVLVNNYQDLRVDKLLAYFGRAEPRDAVDLYFIMQREPLSGLLEQAAQKEPGFDLYWFAVALNRCSSFPDQAERWPVKMLVKFDPIEIKRVFSELSLKIMREITSKPG